VRETHIKELGFLVHTRHELEKQKEAMHADYNVLKNGTNVSVRSSDNNYFALAGRASPLHRCCYGASNDHGRSKFLLFSDKPLVTSCKW